MQYTYAELPTKDATVKTTCNSYKMTISMQGQAHSSVLHFLFHILFAVNGNNDLKERHRINSVKRL